MEAQVIYLPVPKELTVEQRQHWEAEAEKWGDIEEKAYEMRENALRMLGRLGVEQGLEG